MRSSIRLNKNSAPTARILGLILLAGLGLSSATFAAPTLRYDDGTAVTSPIPGSYWETIDIPAQDAVEFRLHRADRTRTEVFYRIDLKYGMDLASRSFDDVSHEVIPRPGRTLWQAHPVQNRTLEKEFLKAAEEFHGKIGSRRPVEKGAGGLVSVRSIRTDLKEFDARGMHADQAAVLHSLRESVVDGWNRILKLRFDVSVPVGFIRLFRGFDSVEPSVSKEGPSEARFDAFSIYPAKVYAEVPKVFGDVLTEVSAEAQWDPLVSLLSELDSDKRKVRLALLILVTHNHASEANLLRTVLATESAAAAWDFSEKMNRLYLQVRSPMIGENSFRHLTGCGGVDPVDLPERKAYHYLGAWALAERLDQTLPWIPKAWQESMLRYATESYIALTDSDPARRAELRKYYDSAITHRKACLKQAPALGERLWAQ